MNFFQLLTQLLNGSYTQDEITSMVLLKYKQNTGNSLTYSTARRYLSLPISDYTNMSLGTIDVLSHVVDTDIRAAIEAKLKEAELV